MKRSFLNIAFLLVTISVGFAQPPSMTASEKETEAYIRKSESEWAESVASGDSSVLERILADDFAGVDTTGDVYDKTKMIGDTKQVPKVWGAKHLEGVK